MRFVVLVAVLGCGDNSSGPVPEVRDGGCRKVPLTSVEDQFAHSSDLGPVVGYTLDDLDPAGRWFFTDAYLNNSSIMIERDEAGHFKSDGLELSHSTTELFGTHLQQRFSDTGPVPDRYDWRFTKRFSNLRDDGSMRYDSAFCEDGETECTVCTARMIRAERFDPQPSEKLSLVGELAPKDWRRTLDVKVLGNTAYLVGDKGLLAIDVTVPAAPAVRGRYPDPDEDTRANDVAVFDAANGRRYALIADSPVQIVDVTDPLDLQPAGQIPVEAHTLFLETRANGTRVYFGGLDGTCPVWDFTDPLHPVRLGAFNANASYVHDLYVEDGIGYLNAWERGFFVVDFNDASAPRQLGHWRSPLRRSHASWVTTVNGRHIAVHGEETYGAHMTVLDVEPSSPTFMQPLSEYETREYVSIHNFTGSGTKTYFTYYQDGVRVVDLANPDAPKLVGYFNTWDPDDPGVSPSFFAGAIGLDLDLARKLVFVADIDRGLLILADGT
jgi:hypothetical protein